MEMESSPKHNVDISSVGLEHEETKNDPLEEMKSVDISEEISIKNVVGSASSDDDDDARTYWIPTNEGKIEGMESMDIHEDNVKLDADVEEDNNKVMTPEDKGYNSDDESSVDSNDEDEIEKVGVKDEVNRALDEDKVDQRTDWVPTNEDKEEVESKDINKDDVKLKAEVEEDNNEIMILRDNGLNSDDESSVDSKAEEKIEKVGGKEEVNRVLDEVEVDQSTNWIPTNEGNVKEMESMGIHDDDVKLQVSVKEDNNAVMTLEDKVFDSDDESSIDSEDEDEIKKVGEKEEANHALDKAKVDQSTDWNPTDEDKEDMESIDIHEDDVKLDAQIEEDNNDVITLENMAISSDDESSVDSKDEDEIEKAGGKEKANCVLNEAQIDKSTSDHSSDPNSSTVTSVLTEKATAIKNFVRGKSEVAVDTFIRRLSGKMNDNVQDLANDKKDTIKYVDSPKAEVKSIWNPLSFLKMMQNDDSENNGYKREAIIEASLEHVVMKGRIILYTRLGCEECIECRLYLHQKRLGYTEINVDIYPTRKVELERISGSSDVPKLIFNEALVGGLKELKTLEELGELDEKIKHLISTMPPREAPLPPFSGEDDAMSEGPIDELALIVRKMKPCIVKDRFYKFRRFKSCFSGSEAVDFLAADQCLQREEAVEVGRKLASQLFFQHVLDENAFEDGNHLYRFLDDDPLISCQCHNIPRGIIELKPRPILDIACRLKLLYRSILEAYTSPDGKHVDYRSIHGSEEFARYLRIIQELHRVELEDMQREEKLAFFINLYNMMAIHAILIWGHPSGPLERTKMFNDFKYVIGANTYSLSTIQNGILRGNQRPPYNLMKPFGAKDKRFKVALPYVESLTHFALVCGTRSGPPLRCFSPKEIDKELLEAARDFLRGGGLTVDLNTKVAYISKIFQWYGADFGNSEEEVLKHASTFLEPQLSEALLDLLVDTQFKVVYQPYDWGLNN